MRDPDMMLMIAGAAMALILLGCLIGAAVGAAQARRAAAREATAIRSRIAALDAFVDALKLDAAEACVHGWPYDGVALLHMLEQHGLLAQAETAELIAAARAAYEREFGKPNGVAKPASKFLALDDEIPF